MSNTTQIATLASMLDRKPSKGQLFAVIKNAIETDFVTEADWAKLYAYFLPSVTKIKSPFDWCVKARGNKDVRHYLNYVYADGERTIATDGYRPVGWYDDADVCIGNLEGGTTYPDIDRVIPSGASVTLKIENLLVEIRTPKLSVYVMPDGTCVDKQYLDQAVALGGEYVLEHFSDAWACKITYCDGSAFAVVATRED